MTLCILGRQPALGLAELERLYGAEQVRQVAPQVAYVDIPLATVLQRPLGSSMKIAEVLDNADGIVWQSSAQKAVKLLESTAPEGKLTLGISAYNFSISPRDVQKTGLIIKQRLKKSGRSVRLIPNNETSLNTAQVLHNRLGTADNKREILIVAMNDGRTVIAQTKQVQDIEAYTFRDRGRPRRDAYVGMLPPKLAQTMINLGGFVHAQPEAGLAQPRLLDPFCGTGVVLQEAALLRYAVYGTDVSEKMIRYSRDNLQWLAETHRVHFDWYLHEADATSATWQQPIDVVVGETYLGKPLSSEPSPALLADIKHECNTIIKNFLKNLARQLAPGTPLCIAVPAWHTASGVHHISALDDLENIGYNRIDFIHASNEDLIYHREDQIVGRELLVLIRSN
ncbi:MAG TPA: methyltransferase domain-containing protein [Candidatus Saccharimonadales bacterium]